MSKLCIFAGTTEGKQLAEALAGRGAELTVCVATEYG
ncbi:MAG: precorrin-6A/cobalt-precorrin-6A reductase, partial [Firmicutes bacterium]|nr:precorrin-6A/cobalt-precorrin-6A reductase [Bacillota bacterium]